MFYGAVSFYYVYGWVYCVSFIFFSVLVSSVSESISVCLASARAWSSSVFFFFFLLSFLLILDCWDGSGDWFSVWVLFCLLPPVCLAASWAAKVAVSV